MTLADLIQIAADEGTDPKDVRLGFQANPNSDIEELSLLDDWSRGTDSGMAHLFILIPEGNVA